MAGTDVPSIDCFPKLEFGKEVGGETGVWEKEWRQYSGAWLRVAAVQWSLVKSGGSIRKFGKEG